MPASSSPPGPDDSPLSEADLRALKRLLEQNLDHGFRLAIIEAANHVDREAILATLAPVIGPGLLRVDVNSLRGAEHNLWLALQQPFAEHAPRCLALWGVESRSEPNWPVQLNVQRDLFVRDYAVPWLVFIHPASRVPMMMNAPDFVDFAALWLRDGRTSQGIVETAKYQRRRRARPSDMAVGSSLLRRAKAALDSARFDEARDLLARYDLQSVSDGDRIPRLLLGARLEREQGHLGLAEAILRETRNVLAREASNPETNKSIQRTEAELGLVFLMSGRLDEAEALLRSSLALIETGVDDSGRGAAMYNLATVLTAQGRYAEAEHFLRECLAIDEAKLGREHPDYGASLGSLAVVLAEQGRYVEAERLLSDALGVKEKAVGREHPDYARALHSLASVYLEQGKYDESEQALREALRIEGEKLGRHHAFYGESLHTLANVMLHQARYEDAETALREVLGINERALGREHPSYGAVLHTLASVMLEQGKYAEAERYIREALSLKERVLGREHPSSSESLLALANVLSRQGKYAEAEHLLGEVLRLLETNRSKRHPSYANALHALGVVLYKQGRFAESERIFRESLSVSESALGSEHRSLGPTLVNLALAIDEQGRKHEAVPFLERAVNIGQAALGAGHPEVRDMQEQLQRLRSTA